MERGQAADRLISEMAARQHGLVTRAQLLSTGMSADTVRWRVRAGRLVPVHRGVYQVGLLISTRAWEMAAVLACGPGAVVSHWSAAVLWKLCAARNDVAPVHVTIRQGDRGHRPGICVHRDTLRAEDTSEVDAVPVTTLARNDFRSRGPGEFQ